MAYTVSQGVESNAKAITSNVDRTPFKFYLTHSPDYGREERQVLGFTAPANTYCVKVWAGPGDESGTAHVCRLGSRLLEDKGGVQTTGDGPSPEERSHVLTAATQDAIRRLAGRGFFPIRFEAQFVDEEHSLYAK